MDTRSNSRRALKSVQEQVDQRRWRNKRDRAWCAAETVEQRSERLKKRRERDHARPAAQAASERQATSQWKSTHKHGAETLRGERWGMEVQRYDTLKEAMKTWRNNLHFLHRTATHIHGDAATNYSVIPWGGAAFSATLFSRQVLVINIASIWWKVLDWALHNNTFRVVIYLYSTAHSRCLVATLVKPCS